MPANGKKNGPKQSQAEAFVRKVAALHFDGEDIGHGMFVLKNNAAACRAYNEIVEEARAVNNSI